MFDATYLQRFVTPEIIAPVLLLGTISLLLHRWKEKRVEKREKQKESKIRLQFTGPQVSAYYHNGEDIIIDTFRFSVHNCSDQEIDLLLPTVVIQARRSNRFMKPRNMAIICTFSDANKGDWPTDVNSISLDSDMKLDLHYRLYMWLLRSHSNIAKLQPLFSDKSSSNDEKKVLLLLHVFCKKISNPEYLTKYTLSIPCTIRYRQIEQSSDASITCTMISSKKNIYRSINKYKKKRHNKAHEKNV